MTNSPFRSHWVFHDSIDREGLEQFATSIAALATSEATPSEVLETVVGSIIENLNESVHTKRYTSYSLLQEKALHYGFHDITPFKRELLKLIGERMIDLHISQLSATQRQKRTQNV